MGHYLEEDEVKLRDLRSYTNRYERDHVLNVREIGRHESYWMTRIDNQREHAAIRTAQDYCERLVGKRLRQIPFSKMRLIPGGDLF